MKTGINQTMKLRLTSFDDMENIIEEAFKASADVYCGYDIDELSSQILDRLEVFFEVGINE